MSSYKNLAKLPSNNIVGEGAFTLTGVNSWVEDGVVLSQAAYPDLFAKIGLIPNNFSTNNSLSLSGTYTTLVYAGGYFLAGSTNGAIQTSTNGSTWVLEQAGGSPITAITYGNGTFVVGNSIGGKYTSTNRSTWTLQNTSSYGLSNLVYGNGVFVFSVNNTIGQAGTSTDGITWSFTNGIGQSVGENGLTYGNGIFAALRGDKNLMTSTNGVTWTFQGAQPGTTFRGAITFGNGLFVYVSDHIIRTSTDCVTWKTTYLGTTSTLASVTYSPSGLFIAHGPAQQLITSTDAVDWKTIQKVPTSISYERGACSDTVCVFEGASSDTRRVLYSYNPSTEFFVPKNQLDQFGFVGTSIKGD